jgi:hypothetical protein
VGAYLGEGLHGEIWEQGRPDAEITDASAFRREIV